ncbi:MAG: peptidase M16 [Candidatus Contendobacter odensis]|uniref:Peptidase M16 n=1 Tax=Candidatus Contendibacter odensensis TaxID=1400860 RepID=A0A2G6PG93_9GAMM|nr:MAG: peptidase M16 [Candidatus Contendobacter odensis]
MPNLKRRLSIAFAAVLLLASRGVIAIPTLEHWQTSNGVPVYFIPAHELPMVDIQILFKAGSAYDDQQPGLAKLTNALLNEGAGQWSADDIADRLDKVGAQFGSSSQRDSAIISLRSLTDPRYLQPSVETVAQLLQQPTFAPEALERLKQHMLTALQEQAQSPRAIAYNTFYEALYGNHPYGSPPDGTEASIKSMTRADVQAFHRRYYTASNAVIALVGDLDRATAEKWVETLASHLPKGQPVPALPPVPPVAKSRTIRIAHPSSQSHILIGQIGVRRTNPDYYALYLGNHVLGGNGLVSLLSQEIREQRGLSYSVYSLFSPMQQAGPFLMNMQTRNDQVDVALQVARKTLQTFTTDGATPQALQEARQNIIGSFALNLAGNRKLVNYLGLIAFYRLPLDYLQHFINTMNGITLDQVNAAWRQQIQPDRQITVVVGGEQQKPATTP